MGRDLKGQIIDKTLPQEFYLNNSQEVYLNSEESKHGGELLSYFTRVCTLVWLKTMYKRMNVLHKQDSLVPLYLPCRPQWAITVYKHTPPVGRR